VFAVEEPDGELPGTDSSFCHPESPENDLMPTVSGERSLATAVFNEEVIKR
jgi:hypothetical protein